MNDFTAKILSVDAMRAVREEFRRSGRELVFTNGCFDLLHAGHATYLAFARRQGDALVVGLNSDASIRRIKGPCRPIVSETHRAQMLAALEMVDFVVLFNEDEPQELITRLIPDVLVKASDWAHYVSGREVVEAHGGRVVLAPMVEGLSTSSIVRRILDVYGSNKSDGGCAPTS